MILLGHRTLAGLGLACGNLLRLGVTGWNKWADPTQDHAQFFLAPYRPAAQVIVPKELNSTTVTLWLRSLEFVVRRVLLLGNHYVYVRVCSVARSCAKSRYAPSKGNSPPVSSRYVPIGSAGLGAKPAGRLANTGPQLFRTERLGVVNAHRRSGEKKEVQSIWMKKKVSGRTVAPNRARSEHRSESCARRDQPK